MNAAHTAAQIAADIASARQQTVDNFVAMLLIVGVVALVIMYVSLEEKDDD